MNQKFQKAALDSAERNTKVDVYTNIACAVVFSAGAFGISKLWGDSIYSAAPCYFFPILGYGCLYSANQSIENLKGKFENIKKSNQMQTRDFTP